MHYTLASNINNSNNIRFHELLWCILYTEHGQLGPDHKLFNPRSLNNTLYRKLKASEPERTAPILYVGKKEKETKKSNTHAQQSSIVRSSEFTSIWLWWRRSYSSLWPWQTSPGSQHCGSVQKQQEAEECSRQTKGIPTEYPEHQFSCASEFKGPS